MYIRSPSPSCCAIQAPPTQCRASSGALAILRPGWLSGVCAGCCRAPARWLSPAMPNLLHNTTRHARLEAGSPSPSQSSHSPLSSPLQGSGGWVPTLSTLRPSKPVALARCWRQGTASMQVWMLHASPRRRRLQAGYRNARAHALAPLSLCSPVQVGSPLLLLRPRRDRFSLSHQGPYVLEL